ncbi:DEAD/DEAH box helicase, partial [Candidatus Woesearchaeota archaeon]|nr:DEAD/DEAH box helicase [Candidatus Woesearchaeota archaeon]
MLKDFSPRLYQETILASASQKNTLVVLPTGMGKTAVALLLSIQRLKNYPNSKIVFLAPTKPLVEQHKATFEKNLDIDNEKMNVFTGFVKPEKRAELWEKSTIIFSTPQGLENDIISERISLKDVSLIVFDEAHRATGDYAYNFIAKQYLKKAKYPRVLALTASPGSNNEKIQEICQNLGIEDVEVRTKDDHDVKQYVQKVDFLWEAVELPEEFLNVKRYLENCMKTKLKEIHSKGLLSKTKDVSKKEILILQASIQARLAKGEKDFDLMRCLSVAAEAIKVQHALELLETQSIDSLLSYLEGIFSEASTSKVKAVQNLAKDIDFKSALVIARKLAEQKIEHPKLSKLKEIVSDEIKGEKKLLIFNNYRENASKIVEELSRISGVRAVLFVGQAKKNGSGLSQKEQKKIVEDFRTGEYNIMVATSIGEEGLDIPKVDDVIFYEPIPSEIRQIQRRGRTGRNDEGKVIILYAKNTRDEAYRWSAHYKEKKMNSILKSLKTTLALKNIHKETLKDFIEDVRIAADYREKGNSVIKELMNSGVKIDLKHLDSADYIISSRIGVEYKTQKDFVDSIIDGRLLHQLKHLKDNFEKPIVVVEGSGDLFSQRNVHANAIRGMIATIIVSYSMPLVFTRDSKETAALFASIAKREGGGKEYSLHTKKPMNIKEQQEYLVSSFPSVGPSL